MKRHVHAPTYPDSAQRTDACIDRFVHVSIRPYTETSRSADNRCCKARGIRLER